MSSVMEYKGYTGSVEYSAEDNLLYGRLVGIRDRILFDGEDVKTLRKHFEGAVEEYLAFCQAEGKTPDKPFKGSLNIRIPAELHRNLTIVAEQEHKSLNSVIAERLDMAVRPPVAYPNQAAVAAAKQPAYWHYSGERRGRTAEGKIASELTGEHSSKTTTQRSRGRRIG